MCGANTRPGSSLKSFGTAAPFTPYSKKIGLASTFAAFSPARIAAIARAKKRPSASGVLAGSVPSLGSLRRS